MIVLNSFAGKPNELKENFPLPSKAIYVGGEKLSGSRTNKKSGGFYETEITT